jgi:hypothetical protein
MRPDAVDGRRMLAVIPEPRDLIAVSANVGRRRFATEVAEVRAATLPNEKKDGAHHAKED